MPPRIKMIWGIPGAGKTRALLQAAEEFHARHGGRVLLITHTNSVVAELRHRLKVSGVAVSTIHALANQLAGFGSQERGRAATKTDGTAAYVRATGLPPHARVMIERHLAGEASPQSETLYAAMIAWCRANGVPHFAAMLHEATRIQRARTTIQFAAVCVDEFQDITPPQWEFIRAVYAPAIDVAMAGDDDQSLYAWANAVPDDMFAERERADENIILAKSYRVPRQVQAIADRLIRQVKVRVQKAMVPRDTEGAVLHVRDYSLDWSTAIRHALEYSTEAEPVLILARSNAILRAASRRLMADKIPYEIWGPLTHARDTPPVSVVRRIRRRHADRRLEEADYRQVAQWRGDKKFGNPDRWAVDWNHPMSRSARLAWEHTAATDGQAPRCILSTIHSAKGREANVVVLLADLPKPSKTALALAAERDAEIRTWYVGVTRARETLIVATNKGNPLLEQAMR